MAAPKLKTSSIFGTTSESIDLSGSADLNDSFSGSDYLLGAGAPRRLVFSRNAESGSLQLSAVRGLHQLIKNNLIRDLSSGFHPIE